MNEEQLIATLQACYFGDRGAFNKILKEYKQLQQELTKYKEKCEKVNELKKVLNNEILDMLPFDISEQVQDLFDEILEDKEDKDEFRK